MSLRDGTRAIIAAVEHATGHPVLVTEDRALRTLVAMRMARGNAPAHTITYNPSATTQLDYLIAFQCGFILRHFANPPSERWDFAPAGSRPRDRSPTNERTGRPSAEASPSA